jgi:hypothetical protein
MNLASLLRLASLLAAALVGPATAQAQIGDPHEHSLSGNARFQIGRGLPMPVGFTPAPKGKLEVVPGGVVTQDHGADPRALRLPAGVLTHMAVPINLPVFIGAAVIFQVHTNIGLQFPKVTGTFSAGKRTGASVVAFCPGDVVTPSGNPGCPNAAGGTGINGMMRYTKTANQFGGPMRANLTGTANIAFPVAAQAPCQAGPIVGARANPGCQVIFALATPAPTGAQGAAFATGTVRDPGVAPNPGRYYMSITLAGIITNIYTSDPQGPGLANPVTSYGAPWTTGMLSILVTAAVGETEQFTFTGSDNRVGGVGSISFVSGSVSDRSLSGPNGNRGWLNLDIGPENIPAPTLSVQGVAAFLGLLGLTGAYALRRRTRT